MPQRCTRILVFLASCGLLISVPALRAQTNSTLLPGPQPPDVPLEWRRLVGIYQYNDPKQDFILAERAQRLFLVPEGLNGPAQDIREEHGTVWVDSGDGSKIGFSESRDANGNVAELSHLLEHYTRRDAGADPAHFYHITPTTPIEQLRAAALAAKPPAEAGPFRKPDLVELAALDPSIHLDIRYAQSDNFLSTPVYTQARAFLQRPAAEALLRVLLKLQPLGYGLLIHDAYRPWYVTKIFWDATPREDHIFVADPEKGSRHNRGCAVDLTLYDLATGKAIEMTGLYDEMSPRSFPNFQGGTSLERWHRDLLRRAMESEGFTVNENEWWHFDDKDWKSYAILNVRFEDLGVAAPRP